MNLHNSSIIKVYFLSVIIDNLTSINIISGTTLKWIHRYCAGGFNKKSKDIFDMQIERQNQGAKRLFPNIIITVLELIYFKLLEHSIIKNLCSTENQIDLNKLTKIVYFIHPLASNQTILHDILKIHIFVII